LANKEGTPMTLVRPPETEDGVKLNFLEAMYGQVHASLLRYTAEVSSNELKVQLVIERDTPEEELDDYMSLNSELLASFYDAMIDEEIIRVDGLEEVRSVPPLPIRLFCRSLP
jgi:hypothetical protein